MDFMIIFVIAHVQITALIVLVISLEEHVKTVQKNGMERIVACHAVMGVLLVNVYEVMVPV